MERAEDYYAGRQPLAFVSDTFRMAFGDRFREFSANFMSLVVDGHRERLQVQGFRIGDNREGDDDAWDWWQRNRLDASAPMAMTESLVKGISYVLVWPDPISGEPEASVESPLQVVVETEPGKPWKRRAALKRWEGEDGRVHAELYLPEGIYKFRSAQQAFEFSLPDWVSKARWDREQPAGEPWPIKNPTGIVPIVPIINRPRLTGLLVDVYGRRVPGGIAPDDGQSEIATVMSNQDVINKLRADMVNASDLAAFRQRWLKNFEVELDEKTGQPKEPFRSAVDRLWILPPPDPEDPTGDQHQPELGEFEQTDLQPMISGVQLEVQALGAISRTPYHYLLPQSGQPPSGESLKAAEAGLEHKVDDSKLYKGEAWEEVIRLNFLFRDDPRGKDLGAETIWRNSESRAEAVHTDAMAKWKGLGIPEEIIWEELGLSPRQIKRIKELIASQPPLQAAGLPLDQQIDAAGALIRAGFQPAAALTAIGLDPIKHLGLLPITLQAGPGGGPAEGQLSLAQGGK
jgi:hypothetical protein